MCRKAAGKGLSRAHKSGGVRSQNRQGKANSVSQVNGDSDWVPARACQLGRGEFNKVILALLLPERAAPNPAPLAFSLKLVNLVLPCLFMVLFKLLSLR